MFPRPSTPMVLLMTVLTTVSACSHGPQDSTAPAVASAVPQPPRAEERPFDVVSPNGVRSDPYYWLRDDTRKDKDVIAYLEAENAYKEAVLTPVKDLRETLYKEIVGRIKADDSSVPYPEGPYLYWQKFETGREYASYMRRPRTAAPDAAGETVLDLNELAKGKSYFFLGDFQPSPNHQLLAYAADDVGRNQYTIRVKEIATGKLHPDVLENVEPNIAWANDNKSFLYLTKDPTTLLGKYVKKHVLGTPVSADVLIYEQDDDSFYTHVERTKSGRYLLIGMESTVSTEYRYADANDPKLVFKTVLPRERDLEYFIAHVDDRFIIRTNWQAPNYRLMEAKVAEVGDRKQWREIVPHRDDALIEDYAVFERYLAINERTGGLSHVRIMSWDGKTDFDVPAIDPSYVMRLDENRELDTEVLRYTYSSLSTPKTTYDINMRDYQIKLLKRQEVVGGFDPTQYVTAYVRVAARDGTKVPVSLLYRKSVALDGKAPCHQYGYGSYGLSQDPDFRSEVLSLVDRGFVFAIAHVRGGEEMGRKWYDAGKLLNKKNTFTDFIDVTHFLVENNYCAKDKVFAEGRSAGGLLMGAIANMAPQDYRGIMAHVPFVDVVTTMLDESIPLTTNEFDEWGNPQEKKYYDYMLSYSPYDHVSAQAYPAMLVTSGLWDSQVQYFEPTKWMARLRARNTGSNPLLLHTNMEAGHGGKSGRFERQRERAMSYAFEVSLLGGSAPQAPRE